MPGNQKCPRCGTPLPAGVLEGLCPNCLLKQGDATDSATQAGGRPFMPPSVEEIARLFPQLEVLAFIGKGGMGAVYRARQKQLDRIVALKILPPGIGGDPAFAERFTREAKALARLNHPGIVTLYEFGSQPSGSGASPLYYFLMEFVDGVNLRQLLNNGRIASREALAIVPQICDALQFAHDQGIVHRDIKPENILLDKRGRVKVADFGLAKLVGVGNEPAGGDSPSAASPVMTDAGKIIGTPQYMAPEQAARPGDVDHRADIYALGVVFYQMLTGELPGKQLEPPSHKVQIDVRLDEVVLRALEKEPEQRYQQASVLKTQVETIAASPDALDKSKFAGREQRSKQTIFGIPLVHVAWGTDPATGKPRVAKGIVAVGSVAKGVVAVGIEAYGVFATGVLAIGLLPVGVIAVGILTSAVFAVGIDPVGLLAVGWSPVGAVSIGFHSVGLLSAGRHAVGLLKPKWTPAVFFTALAVSCLLAFFLRAVIRTVARSPGTDSLRNSSKFAVRNLVIASCLIPLGLLVLIWSGINSLPQGPRYGVWYEQPLALIDNTGPAIAELHVTDIVQHGRVVSFSLVDEGPSEKHEIFVKFDGPPADAIASEGSTEFDNPMAPSSSRDSKTARAYPAALVVAAPGRIPMSFIFPDEATAEIAANQSRQVRLGVTNRLLGDESMDLFDLMRNMRATGKSDWIEELKATLTVSPMTAQVGATPASVYQSDLFYIGKVSFLPDDFIQITSVHRSVDQMVVKGRYWLASHSRALLGLHIATDKFRLNQTRPVQMMEIKKGEGDFTLVDPSVVAGYPCVSMYGGGDAIPFGSICFGSREQALEENLMKVGDSPARTGDYMKSAVYCGVSEGTIYDYQSGKPWMAGVSGMVFSPPPYLNWERDPDNFWNWAHDQGIHLIGLPLVSQKGLSGFEMDASRIMDTNITFENITPEQVQNALRENREPRSSLNGGPWLVRMAWGDSPHNLFAIVMDTGQPGVLQLTGLTENPPGIAFRFNLLGWYLDSRTIPGKNEDAAEKTDPAEEEKIRAQIAAAETKHDPVESARLNIKLSALKRIRLEKLNAEGKATSEEVDKARDEEIIARLLYKRAQEAAADTNN